MSGRSQRIRGDRHFGDRLRSANWQHRVPRRRISGQNHHIKRPISIIQIRRYERITLVEREREREWISASEYFLETHNSELRNRILRKSPKNPLPLSARTMLFSVVWFFMDFLNFSDWFLWGRLHLIQTHKQGLGDHSSQSLKSIKTNRTP